MRLSDWFDSFQDLRGRSSIPSPSVHEITSSNSLDAQFLAQFECFVLRYVFFICFLLLFSKQTCASQLLT